MPLFALLPVLVFLALFLRFATSSKNTPPSDIQLTYAFIVSSIVLGLLVTVSSEILSLLDGLARAPIALFWLACLILVAYKASIIDHAKAVAAYIEYFLKRLSRFEKIVVFCLTVFLGLTFTVAVISPPNNADSLLYHMTRVAHWTQNHNLNHYATAYDHQLFMPIWAETAILHLRILFGSDQLSNLVQWFSFLGCILLGWAVARLMGFPRRARMASAVFIATIPLGLLESTSTQNDLVVAYWLSCLVFLILYGRRSGYNWVTTGMIGVVTGLGLLTKVTFYVYALPAWAGIIYLWFLTCSKKQVFAQVGFSIILVIGVNSGFWARNVETYGNPIGPIELVRSSISLASERDSGMGEDPTFGVAEEQGSLRLDDGTRGESDAAGILSRLLWREKRMVMWNFAVPFASIRDRVPAIDSMLALVLDEEQYSDLDTTVWNHEDTSGNPIQMVLVAAAFATIIVLALRKALERDMLLYAILVFTAYIMLPVVISNADTVYSLRFQLPFFVLSGSLIASFYTILPHEKVKKIMILGLVGLSLPWLVFNNTRPIIGWQPYLTRVRSVFLASDRQLLFAMQRGEQDEYLAISSAIQDAGCKKVGLVLDSHDYEYLIWDLLDAPESGVEIKSIETTLRLSRYLDPTYSPCAVVCTRCQGESTYQGRFLWADYGYIQLFLDHREVE
jgi:hypothetical protein